MMDMGRDSSQAVSTQRPGGCDPLGLPSFSTSLSELDVFREGSITVIIPLIHVKGQGLLGWVNH